MSSEPKRHDGEARVREMLGLGDLPLPPGFLERLKIDRANLDEEIQEQAGKYAYWLVRLSELEALVDRLESERTRVKAELDPVARTDLAQVDRPTNEKVEMWIIRNEKYQNVVSAILDAKRRLGLAKAIERAYDQRGWMIRALATREAKARAMPDSIPA